MSDRLCGYCRNPGHRKPDCPTFEEHRNLILTHTPKQRKEAIESLAKIGLGIGALIKVRNGYDNGADYLGYIRDFDWLSRCNFVDVRNMKYSKQVRIITLDVKNDYEYRSLHMSIVLMGDGRARESNIGIRLSKELRLHGTPNYKIGSVKYSWEDCYEVVSPSNDIDYDPAILVKDVQMPPRLLRGNEREYVTGILPA